jgi:hypothetical protein
MNRNAPGIAQFMELPHTGHTFEHYASMQGAFEGKPLAFDDRLARSVSGCFTRHR